MKRVKTRLSIQEQLLPKWAHRLSTAIQNALLNECERFSPPVSPGELTIELVLKNRDRIWYAPNVGPKRFKELMAYIGHGPSMWPERMRP